MHVRSQVDEFISLEVSALGHPKTSLLMPMNLSKEWFAESLRRVEALLLGLERSHDCRMVPPRSLIGRYWRSLRKPFEMERVCNA